MTKVIGITGGIGSGKTTLSKHLTKLGYLVHESDKVVFEMYDSPSKQFINFVKNNISQNAVKGDRLNKKEITKNIFTNNQTKKKLEKYIHKKVQLSRKKFIQSNLKNHKKIIFVDIPLLLEKKLDNEFDLVICIISSKKNRIKRVLKNKKFSKNVLNKIFKSQTTDKERRRRSQIIINNNKTKKDFIFNIKKALMKIIK
tara:strand:- start:478 stop:1074 length:597 start_codon:yes stop_codon:yes gene_type:complete